MIFSIVGYDAQSGDLGIAVASKLLAVGAVVPDVVDALAKRVLEHGIDPIVLRHLREQHAP
jgi:uncharacterized Ntn-hydrolase superfamily protein